MNSLPSHPRPMRAVLTALGLGATSACVLLAIHALGVGPGLGAYTLAGLLAIAVRDYSWHGPPSRRPAAPPASVPWPRHLTSRPPARARQRPTFGESLRKQTHAQ